ncbi:hypothetical protein MKX03_008442 [Papaver bracteatum]|nr:hypothetical protein MKX03_008442 [Papaver bracteatum]
MEGQSWNKDTCEDEWNTDGNCMEESEDGNCIKESEDCLGFESDCEMINGYCENGDNRITEETKSIEKRWRSMRCVLL